MPLVGLSAKRARSPTHRESHLLLPEESHTQRQNAKSAAFSHYSGAFLYHPWHRVVGDFRSLAQGVRLSHPVKFSITRGD
jgi:hypothetical protein